ncbi:hypothetical protein OQZ33_21535 [Pedobacter sp. MC2016-05]|uniref:Crp/Fnr family transcriptional regulator n=1 Tax=Pedobacter sp. MC2016-05 TaxID=2994474 RepID=UPI002245C4C9|nr:hypothetical protein [Pedobacter sp. MC2016-05]MCX2476931.1 hypothetical protein [Pedobacter sp. MC2016-05]
MEKENYLHQLGKDTAISAGLAAYINYVITAQPFPAKQILPLNQSGLNITSLISQGSARLFLKGEEYQEQTLLFFQENSFPGLERNLHLLAESTLYLEFLEESEIMMLPDDHIANLFRLFPEFPNIQNDLNRTLNQTLLNHQLQLSLYDSYERYEKFLKEYAHISLVCEQKKIASYLGIDPKTLSRLRGRPRRK